MKEHPEITFDRLPDETTVVRLSGDWELQEKLPSSDDLRKHIENLSFPRRIVFDAANLKAWDSGLLIFLTKVINLCAQHDVRLQKEGLPDGVKRLLHLASAVPERKGTAGGKDRISFLEQVADKSIAAWRSSIDIFDFLGEVVTAFARMLIGKARFRRSDLFMIMQECGAHALPIVSLISFLVGLILAFIGAIQLKIFGAQIYVASLVGIGMVRALAAVMTGIIMAGRTGASFAAQLGTMQVNEEIDALKTLGISPIEFLVLPRILALCIMMPLLSIYANLMGILGGMFIGVSMLDLNFMEYYIKTKESITLNHFWVGVFSAAVFGVLVAISGCLRGMQCSRSASAVGEATTSAVVTGIVSIVVATAVITFICNILGI
jgi:phospholipid/cholesterol/gamma-HCH transport system permease protein